MAYVSGNYMANPAAPLGKWVCDKASSLGPFNSVPQVNTEAPDFCGQCVSFVKRVCPSLPRTSDWRKGRKVFGDASVQAGTVIATFKPDGTYFGHAAIYDGQDAGGLYVYDQFRSGTAPMPISRRYLRPGASYASNDAAAFFIIE